MSLPLQPVTTISRFQFPIYLSHWTVLMHPLFSPSDLRLRKICWCSICRITLFKPRGLSKHLVHLPTNPPLEPGRRGDAQSLPRSTGASEAAPLLTLTLRASLPPGAGCRWSGLILLEENRACPSGVSTKAKDCTLCT